MTSRLARVSRSLALALVAGFGVRESRAHPTVDFDDLPLAPNSYFNGPAPNGQVVGGPYGPVTRGTFESRGVQFVNNYDQTFGSWSGFAYSNTTDTTTPGFTNQFSAFAGSGRGPGHDNYGVAFGYDDLTPNLIDPTPFDPTNVAHLERLPHFLLPDGANIAGMFVTNTTYAALSMLEGDGFAKKFGGATGNDPDWFKLSAFGTDASGHVLSTSVDFYLADFRFADNRLDYVVRDWTYMDLSALSGAKTLYFNVSSSDAGPYGLNTPGYFAVDDVRFAQAVPEPSGLALAAAGASTFGLPSLRKRARGRRAS